MSLKITANSLLKKHFLIVDSNGVKFYDGTGFASSRRFLFKQIACVLLSPDNVLSFQVNNEVFSIPVKPNDAKQQAVIDALLWALRQTTAGTS